MLNNIYDYLYRLIVSVISSIKNAIKFYKSRNWEEFCEEMCKVTFFVAGVIVLVSVVLSVAYNVYFFYNSIPYPLIKLGIKITACMLLLCYFLSKVRKDKE